jgi:hypothetical protein
MVLFKPTADNVSINITAKDNANINVSLIEPSVIIYKTGPINSTTSNTTSKNIGTIMVSAGIETSLYTISILDTQVRSKS